MEHLNPTKDELYALISRSILFTWRETLSSRTGGKGSVIFTVNPTSDARKYWINVEYPPVTNNLPFGETGGYYVDNEGNVI